MPRPASVEAGRRETGRPGTGRRGSGRTGGSPRSTGAAGRSAFAVWRRQRRARRHRLVLVAALAVVGVSCVVSAAGAALGLLGGLWASWGLLSVSAALGFGALALWPRSDPERWARGAAGELATAALLERLPRGRWVVLHDLGLPGSRANVDHLVIGPTGVWVVDTKAYRARISARLRRARVAGAPLPVAAVRWEAEVVSGLLGVGARPVVALHSSGLPRRGRKVGGVRVVPAAHLVRRLRRGQYLWPSLDRRAVQEVGGRAEKLLTRRW